MIRTLIVVALVATSCGGTKVARSGEGTGNTKIDQAALGLGLDKVDLDHLADGYTGQLFESRFWRREVQAVAPEYTMSIWPIENMTSQHLGDELGQLLSSLETDIVNSGDVTMVARSRQSELLQQLGVQQGAAYDPAAAQQVGMQLGVKYFLTGKLSSVDERIENKRRVQYTLFLQVIELETGAIKFQGESSRTKAMKG